jgi:2-iminoacetate synthase
LNAIEVIKAVSQLYLIEVQPLSQEEYERLHEAGVYSVLVYQETYHQKFTKSTTKGKKSNLTLDWIPRSHWESRIHKIGLGVLFWKTGARIVFNALHLIGKKRIAN